MDDSGHKSGQLMLITRNVSSTPACSAVRASAAPVR